MQTIPDMMKNGLERGKVDSCDVIMLMIVAITNVNEKKKNERSNHTSDTTCKILEDCCTIFPTQLGRDWDMKANI